MALGGTGFPQRDAETDFLRARRRRALARVGGALRGHWADVDPVLPFEEVVAALGQTGRRDLGVQVIPLDSVVGSVDRTADFDRRFRPRTGRVRGRWERIAAAMRRGEPLPPISVFRVGEAHFVRDGHHRVSVARALSRGDIEAHVVEVTTRVGASATLSLDELPMKSHERLFHERVPLGPAERERIVLRAPRQWGLLAEGVEAWAFRAQQATGEVYDRPAAARAWFERDYLPVVEGLREAGLVRRGETDAEAYLRASDERYQRLGTHEWDTGVWEALRE